MDNLTPTQAKQKLRPILPEAKIFPKLRRNFREIGWGRTIQKVFKTWPNHIRISETVPKRSVFPTLPKLLQNLAETWEPNRPGLKRTALPILLGPFFVSFLLVFF